MSVDISFLYKKQVPCCFDENKLINLLSMKEIFNARKMIILCESELSGVANQISFYIAKKCSIFLGIDVYATDGTNFPKTDKEMNLGEPDSPCILALSRTGEEKSLCEKVKYLTNKGAMSIAITAKRNSTLVKNAKRSFILADYKKASYETDYYSIIIGLLAIISRISEVKGLEAINATYRWKKVVLDYLKSLEDSFNNKNLLSLKKDLHKKPFVEIVSDEYTNDAEFFMRNCLINNNGIFTSFVDSEDWCHVNYFYKNPEKIVTLFFINRLSSAYSRVLETIKTSTIIKRDTYSIETNKEDIAGVKSILMPAIEEGYEWLVPLFEPLVIDYVTKGEE